MVGEVGKPHGVRGEVYVVEISDDRRRFEPGSRLLHADGRELTVEAGRRHRGRFLVKFEGIDDREAAQALRGALYISSDRLRNLLSGEFWEHDLAGCRAVAPDGREVGRVARVVPGIAHDLLAVDTGGQERLVPFVKEIVLEVDSEQRRVVVDAPEGLLD